MVLSTAKRSRVGQLKGYGNAIVPQVAAAFITAFMEYLTEANLTEANLTGVTLHTAIGDGVRIRTTKTERYIINHYDDRCQIGCKNHTLEEWAAFMDDEISAMDDGALEWWKEWREFVLTEKKGEE